MFKATRLFIKDRQKFSSLEIKLINVNYVGGGISNNCSDNAINESERNNDILAVTGWLIHPYNSLKNSTEIIQHWWNFDERSKTYYDTTPNSNNIKCDYVLDFELYKYTYDHFNDIKSIVACSLIQKNGKYTAALADAPNIRNIRYKEINDLSTKTLYTFF